MLKLFSRTNHKRSFKEIVMGKKRFGPDGEEEVPDLIEEETVPVVETEVVLASEDTPALNPRFMFVDEVPDKEVMKEAVVDKGDLAKVQDRVMMAYRISRDKAVNNCLESALEELKKLTGNQ